MGRGALFGSNASSLDVGKGGRIILFLRRFLLPSPFLSLLLLFCHVSPYLGVRASVSMHAPSPFYVDSPFPLPLPMSSYASPGLRGRVRTPVPHVAPTMHLFTI